MPWSASWTARTATDTTMPAVYPSATQSPAAARRRRASSTCSAATTSIEIGSTATAGDPATHLVDPVPRRAAGADARRRRAVVEAPVVPDVRQAVPLRRALQRHGDEVVRVARALRIR